VIAVVSERELSMDRRTFLGSIGAVAAGEIFAGRLHAESASPTVAPSPQKASHWPDEVYRRSSVDIHVPDWDPALLSRFNAAEFVETLARGGVQSYLQYTNSHVGLCLWKTKVGREHAGEASA